jgi:co-chaperonin GroES (HSP10)
MSDGGEKLPIKMLADRLLVRIPDSEGERRSSGGILIPATAQLAKRLVWAEVVALGPNVRSAETGDQVLFSPEDRCASATSTPWPPSASKRAPASTSEVAGRQGAAISSGVRTRSTQNSLPSGSASTVQVWSPCPMSTRVAPRASRRATSPA